MENRAKQKLHAEDGFTLGEVLLAVLILLMVSAIMASGIPAARNAYERVVLASNAEVLLSTTISTLRNELGTAQEVDAAAPDASPSRTDVTYLNPSRGTYSRIEVAEDHKIIFYRYYYKDGLGKPSASVSTQLISDETATNGLYVSYESVSWDKARGIVTFRGIVVRHSDASLTKARDLSIRVISYQDD